MLAILQRLQEWYNLSQVPHFQEEPEIEAGRKAELFLRNLVTSHVAYKGSHTFIGKRVPAPKIKARKEIDLIVITPKQIHTLEVKNWSGELKARGDKWVQIKRNGDEIEFPNLVAYNSDKCELLLDYLATAGIPIKRQFISQKVVFMNHHLKVDKKIYDLPDVITPEKLQNFLDAQHRQTLAEKLLFPVVEYCLSIEKAEATFDSLGGEKLDKTVAAITAIGTWDRLVLNGNKTMAGDLLKIHTKTLSIDRDQLSTNTKMELTWTRSKFWGLVKAILGIASLGYLKVSSHGTFALSTRDYVKFQEAGAAEPSFTSLSYINHIILG